MMMEQVKESDFGKPTPPKVKNVLAKTPKSVPMPTKIRNALAKTILKDYKRTEVFFREDGIKDYRIKPRHIKTRLLYSTSHHAIRVVLEGHDYANKTV